MDVYFKTPLIRKIPLTRIKMLIARILYRILKLILRRNTFLIRRRGIFYAVDISEGIDLSLFLFGGFQDYVTRNKYICLLNDAVVFDVGANVGVMSLKFAQMLPNGCVYAFEPTDYAFKKLLQNLSLNPNLSKRIKYHQLFLSDRVAIDHQIRAYSSWKLDISTTDTHPLHGGIIKTAHSIPSVTLDSYCDENSIKRIDLIKIDTDGHELNVLLGAKNAIAEYMPYIIFEIGLYMLHEKEIEFYQYYSFFTELGYSLINAKNGEDITLKNFFNKIPHNYTIDLIALPSKA